MKKLLLALIVSASFIGMGLSASVIKDGKVVSSNDKCAVDNKCSSENCGLTNKSCDCKASKNMSKSCSMDKPKQKMSCGAGKCGSSDKPMKKMSCGAGKCGSTN